MTKKMRKEDQLLQTKLPKDEESSFRRWHLKVKYIFPDSYKKCLEQENYLAAFLLLCNLLEFHLIQYLSEFSYYQEQAGVKQPAAKSTSHGIRTRTYYVEKEYTLGRLIGDAKDMGVSGEITELLGTFLEKRNLLIHNILDLKHVDLDITSECREACLLAEQVWELIKEGCPKKG